MADREELFFAGGTARMLQAESPDDDEDSEPSQVRKGIDRSLWKPLAGLTAAALLMAGAAVMAHSLTPRGRPLRGVGTLRLDEEGEFLKASGELKAAEDLKADETSHHEDKHKDKGSKTSAHRTSNTTTTTSAPPGPKPTLFCWSHMQPDSAEEVLVKEQLKREASIFACNGFAVISTKAFEIGEYRGASVFTWENQAPSVPIAQYGVNGAKTDSFLNTQTFLLGWDSLLSSGHIWPYDFVVKVDPDAVFFPDRLRNHVKDHVGHSVYFPNCGKWGGEPHLYGSIEVFSVSALGAYQARIQECKRLPWQGWGEDYYMQHCMDMIGVGLVYDGNQVGDRRCIDAPCTDWGKVAFHPYKDPKQWFECFDQAIGR